MQPHTDMHSQAIIAISTIFFIATLLSLAIGIGNPQCANIQYSTANTQYPISAISGYWILDTGYWLFAHFME